MNFDYRSYPNQVYFGQGKINILPELLRSYKKVLVIAAERLSGQVKLVKSALGENRVIQFSDIIQHVPDSIVRSAMVFREEHQPEIIVAIGGGSAIGLAKALALEKFIPQIAIPTTFSGSEQTNIYGISTAGAKKTGRDDKVLPGIVIYDSDLVLTMPKHLAVTSAMNAMAHLMETIYSPSENPVMSSNAILGMDAIKKGIEALSVMDSLTAVVAEKLLFGAYLGGKCLCESQMALHHKAAHVLGGSFGLEHSVVHTVLQSYVLDYQWPHLSVSIREDFKRVLDSDYPPRALKELADHAGAKTDLKSIGFKEEDIEKAAEMIMANPYPNPAPINKNGVMDLLFNAYHGNIG